MTQCVRPSSTHEGKQISDLQTKIGLGLNSFHREVGQIFEKRIVFISETTWQQENRLSVVVKISELNKVNNKRNSLYKIRCSVIARRLLKSRRYKIFWQIMRSQVNKYCSILGVIKQYLVSIHEIIKMKKDEDYRHWLYKVINNKLFKQVAITDNKNSRKYRMSKPKFKLLLRCGFQNKRNF